VEAGAQAHACPVCDMNTMQCRMLPKMSVARSGAGACFGPDGALYVTGGSSDGCVALDSVERIDPREGNWQQLAPLPSARGYMSTGFSLNGVMHAAGGFDDSGCTDAFEAYDPRADGWRVMESLPVHRSNLATVFLE